VAYQASQIFGRPLVKRLTLCYRTVVCPAGCVSVTLVYCGQTVGLIKMKLGIEVGLGPGHIVLDGRPSSPTERGTAVHHFSAAPYCGGGGYFACSFIVPYDCIGNVGAGRPTRQLLLCQSYRWPILWAETADAVRYQSAVPPKFTRDHCARDTLWRI